MSAAESIATVERYLTALATRDWDGLADCLETDVERVGPYNDRYHGCDAYVKFLAETLATLLGYELQVARIIGGGATVVVELAETVDTPDGRRRTDEAVIFDLSPRGKIHRVQVFLRKARIVRARSAQE